MIPVRFFTASSLVMRLRKAKDGNRLDAELKSIGRAGLARHRRARLPAHRHRRGQASVPGRRGQLRDPQRHLHLEPRVRQMGDVFGDGDMAAAVIDRIVHHGRILRFHGESYRNKHSLMK